uniref:Uncharacterized protein n=1 Tax=Culex tarsalis TaxID=7177 RepID=A0A1Q3F191_CULTA
MGKNGKKAKQNPFKEKKLTTNQMKRLKKLEARYQPRPLVIQMQNCNDCPTHEVRKLMRRMPHILANNPNFQVVRFCLPGYPEHWIQAEGEIEPFASFIKKAFRGQKQVQHPLDIHLAGGYVLVLVPNPESAAFARSLTPGLCDFLGTAIREPSLAEIKQFHANWTSRSPRMFQGFRKKN